MVEQKEQNGTSRTLEEDDAMRCYASSSSFRFHLLSSSIRFCSAFDVGEYNKVFDE